MSIINSCCSFHRKITITIGYHVFKIPGSFSYKLLVNHENFIARMRGGSLFFFKSPQSIFVELSTLSSLKLGVVGLGILS